MKKQTIMALVILGIILISISLIIKPSLTGFVVYSENSNEKIRLGYCPTMQEEAILFSEKENYELVKFGFASEVLSSLKNKEINKALIGRKAEGYEISKDVKETILESGYTLVSNNKKFIDYSQLPYLEIYTYLSEDIAENLISHNSKIIYLSKQEAINKISQGKIVLISWEDWRDDFDFIVVMNGNKKVKDFRGVFLYEN